MKKKKQGLGLLRLIFAFFILGAAWIAFAEVSPEPDQGQAEAPFKLEEPLESEDLLPFEEEPLSSEETSASEDPSSSQETFPDKIQ